MLGDHCPLNVIVAADDIEPKEWVEIFDELRVQEPTLKTELDRLMALPQVTKKDVEKERAKIKKRTATLKAQMEKAKASIKDEA